MMFRRNIKGEALKNRGFTIIELLIATAVLSTILVIVTSMMIAISNLYYKGVNQSRTQNNARTIMDDVSGELKFSDNPVVMAPNETPPIPVQNPGTTAHAYCIGSTRYSYLLYRQIGSDTGINQSLHVLWKDTITSGGCTPADLSAANPSGSTGTNGSELIAPGTRLTKFSINPTTSPWAVEVGVAFGDNDLICDDGPSGDCSTRGVGTQISKLEAGTLNLPSGNIVCKGTIGSQFCATAQLTTTVIKRKV